MSSRFTSGVINMGIYYFAVDYDAKEQMWASKKWSDKYIDYPTHPLPCMIAMKNMQGHDFTIINDVSSDIEHSFKDVTEEVYKEWKEKFPDFEWEQYEK